MDLEGQLANPSGTFVQVSAGLVRCWRWLRCAAPVLCGMGVSALHACRAV